MMTTKSRITPVGQIVEMTLREIRSEGQDGATLSELVERTGRTEKAVRQGLKTLVGHERVRRVERTHPVRNCPISTLYRLPS